MNSSSDPTRRDFFSVLKWGLLVIVSGVILLTVLQLAGVLSTPGRIISRTLSPDNVITSYEWFYDTNAQFVSRSNQIKAHSEMVKAESDPKERSRLNIELSAVRQSCRDLATKYNANSEKANKMLFRSGDLPQSLSISQCEG